jgi:hypothetical protein
MERAKSHLSSLGAILVLVAVGAVVYATFNTSSSAPADRSGPESGELAPKFADQTATPRPKSPQASQRAGHAAGTRVPAAGSARISEAARGAIFPGDSGHPGATAPALVPVSDPVPVRPRSGRPKPDTVRGINRELRRLAGGPHAQKPRPAPRPRHPATPRPPVSSPAPDNPVSTQPVGGPQPQPEPIPDGTAPGGDPTTTPPDPDADLDDTPVGGLDPTDIGGPIDETDPAPPPA